MMNENDYLGLLRAAIKYGPTDAGGVEAAALLTARVLHNLERLANMHEGMLLHMDRLATAVELIGGLKPAAPQPKRTDPWAKPASEGAPVVQLVTAEDVAVAITEFLTTHGRASREGTSLSLIRMHWHSWAGDRFGGQVPDVDWSYSAPASAGEDGKWVGDWRGTYLQ